MTDASPGASRDEGQPFLDSDPPHWAVRGLAYLLVALFATSVVAALVVNVPETVSAPFVLIPMRGADPVRAPWPGTITRVAIEEGQTVTAGDELFVVESQNIGDRSADRSTLDAQSKGATQSRVNARSRYELQRLTDEAEQRRLEARLSYLTRTIDMKRKQLVTTVDLANRHKTLQAEGLMNVVDASRAQLEADRLEVEIEEAEREAVDAKGQIATLQRMLAVRESELNELTRTLEEDIEKARIRINALNRDLVDSLDNRFAVRASCGGIILRLAVRAPGAVVKDGDLLAELACSGEQLQAQLTVPQSGLGLIKPGQPVKLLYDAFPYQRYGVRSGEVQWVSPATVENPTGPAFLARAEIDPGAITVQGQPRPLTPGMAGRAQVIVGKRSLISFAFEPIRQLKESISDAPRRPANPEP